MQLIGKELLTLIQQYFKRVFLTTNHSLLNEKWIAVNLSKVYILEQEIIIEISSIEFDEFISWRHNGKLVFQECDKPEENFIYLDFKENLPSLQEHIQINKDKIIKILTGILMLVYQSTNSIFHLISKIIVIELTNKKFDLILIKNFIEKNPEILKLSNQQSLEIYQVINIILEEEVELFNKKRKLFEV